MVSILTRGICSLAVLLLAACSFTSVSPSADQPLPKNIVAANYNIQLGVGYLDEGYTKRAKRKLLNALSLAPDYPPAYSAMAYFLEQTGSEQEADQYYRKSIELNPELGLAQNNYGVFLCKQGQYQQSIEHFLKAVADPDYLEDAAAYENAGLCALEIPDAKLARTYFKRSMQEDPKRPLPPLELAQLSYDEGDFVTAKKYLKAYEVTSSQASPQSLLLAIQIAQQLGESNWEQQAKTELEQKYPEYH